MKLEMFESKMLKDAVIEYWHSHMKHSNNERVREQYRCMMIDLKTITETNDRFTLTLND